MAHCTTTGRLAGDQLLIRMCVLDALAVSVVGYVDKAPGFVCVLYVVQLCEVCLGVVAVCFLVFCIVLLVSGRRPSGKSASVAG